MILWFFSILNISYELLLLIKYLNLQQLFHPFLATVLGQNFQQFCFSNSEVNFWDFLKIFCQESSKCIEVFFEKKIFEVGNFKNFFLKFFEKKKSKKIGKKSGIAQNRDMIFGKNWFFSEKMKLPTSKFSWVNFNAYGTSNFFLKLVTSKFEKISQFFDSSKIHFLSK